MEPDAIEGKGLETSAENSVLLDRSLKSETIKIGTRVKDARSGAMLKVAGFIDDQTYSHTPVALISIETWEAMSGGSESSELNAIVIKKDNPELKQGVSSLINNGEWVEKDKVVKGIPGFTAEQNSLYMMLSFLIVIAVFVLAAFFLYHDDTKNGTIWNLESHWRKIKCFGKIDDFSGYLINNCQYCFSGWFY